MANITRLKLSLCLIALALMPVAATGYESYELRYDADGPALNDVCALEVDGHAVFWAVGDQGRVFKIVDGQLTDSFTVGWGNYDFHGVSAFPGGETVYVVGYKRDTPDRWQGIVFRTLLGGAQWDYRIPPVPSGVKLPLLKVQCVPDHYLWASCGNGTVLWSNDWYTWWPYRPLGDSDYSYIWGLWVYDSLHAWVASDESMAIAKTANMGAAWSIYRPLPDDSLSYRGIGPWDLGHGRDFDYMSVAATRGAILHTTDGGDAWVKDAYNPCQWWRGVSQNYSDGYFDRYVGTSGTRYDLNDVENLSVGAHTWCVAVGTKGSIHVQHGAFGIKEEWYLDEIDAVSRGDQSVDLNIHFYNTTGVTHNTTVYIWRSICQEDWGTDQAAFYQHVYTIYNVTVPQNGGWISTWTTPALPYDIEYWFGATTSLAAGYAASPNVDSAHAVGAQHHDPIPAPSSFTASDLPSDHGSSLQYQWSSVSEATYAVIRPRTESHPNYYGHQGGLVAITSSTSGTEGELVTGVEYRRGVRSLDGVTSSLTFAEDCGTPVDNTAPPVVTGLSARYVPEIDACEVWWNPVPEGGDPAYPETYEPNLGGYWVCPCITDAALDDPDPHDSRLNHQSPLFRNRYIQAVPQEAHKHQWVFSIKARDRSDNAGQWCEDLYVDIPNIGTTSPTATAYNNGTHLARVPGTANECVAYENNSEVRYASSTDGGNVWQNRTTLDTGASPAIAMDESAYVWVVYLRDNIIRYKFSNPGTAWGGGVLYDPDDENVVLGPPTIAARTSSALHYAYAAFPVYNLNAGTSVVKVVKFDETTAVVVNVEATPNQAMSDSFVSLSLTPGDSVHCCWQRGSAILYSEARVAPAQWSPITWTNPATLSQQGMVAKHPFCADWGDRVIVVWSDHSTGEIMRVWRQVATPVSWSLPANVSNTQQFSDFPQASSPCAVSWEDLKGSGNWEVRARAGTDLVTLTSDVNGNSRYAHISAELADSSDNAPTAIYAVWTDGTAEDDYYEVKSCVWGQGGQGGGMAARQVPITVTELSSVAPNPFTRATGIRYQLARAGRTRLSVYDAAGREVRTLVNTEQNRGAYTVTWNGTDVRGRSVPRGVYFLRFDAPDCTGQRKLTLTR